MWITYEAERASKQINKTARGLARFLHSISARLVLCGVIGEAQYDNNYRPSWNCICRGGMRIFSYKKE